MNDRYDVVIVGGAAMGSSTAHFLAANPDFDGSVLVIERDPTYTYAATALSSSSIRHQFSTDVNIALSMFGSEFIRNFADHCGVGDDRPDLGFRENGYLYLVPDKHRETLIDNHERQRRLGANVELLEPEQLRERYPWMNTEGVSIGNLGATGEGWFDNVGLMQGMRTRARANGVDWVRDEAVAVTRQGDRITSVALASGATVECGFLVNAAGSWADDLCGYAGVEIPVEPHKHCIFVFACREDMPSDMPAVIAPSGAFCRPEGDLFLSTIDLEVNTRAARDDYRVVNAEFEEHIWPDLAELIPAFESIKLMRSWAGHYEYNVFDQNGIVGPHAEIDNFMLANGFSGHGLQHSPGVGRGVSELITYGEFRTLDLTPLSHERIVQGEPLLENLVI